MPRRFRSSCLQVFCKKGVIKNLTKFMGKHGSKLNYLNLDQSFFKILFKGNITIMHTPRERGGCVYGWENRAREHTFSDSESLFLSKIVAILRNFTVFPFFNLIDFITYLSTSCFLLFFDVIVYFRKASFNFHNKHFLLYLLVFSLHFA